MINKEHVNYPAYVQEWKKIRSEMGAEVTESEGKDEASKALDGGSFDKISKAYAKRFKDLQKKYSYLFSE